MALCTIPFHVIIILHYVVDHILYHPIYHLIISYHIIIINQISCHIVSCHIILHTTMFSCLGGLLPTAKGSQGIHELCVLWLSHLRGKGKTHALLMVSFFSLLLRPYVLFSPETSLLSLWCFPPYSPNVFLLILSFLAFSFSSLFSHYSLYTPAKSFKKYKNHSVGTV